MYDLPPNDMCCVIVLSALFLSLTVALYGLSLVYGVKMNF